jgi:hypothetical protein
MTVTERVFFDSKTVNCRSEVTFNLSVWLLPLDLSGMGGPTSSYATAGIALRVCGNSINRFSSCLTAHWFKEKVAVYSGNPAGDTKAQGENYMSLC